jgi:putative membrane protein
MKLKIVATALAMTLATQAFAQTEVGKGVPPAVAVASNITDAITFVDRAALAGIFEVRASELAVEKGKDPKVIAFAKRMIEDHTAAMQRLVETAKAADLQLTPPIEVDASHADEMDQLRGATEEFDTLYLEQQRAAHDEAIALFSGFAENGDNDQLKQLAANLLPTLKEHRAMLD